MFLVMVVAAIFGLYQRVLLLSSLRLSLVEDQVLLVAVVVMVLAWAVVAVVMPPRFSMPTVIISLPGQHSTQFVQDQLVDVPVAVVAMAGELRFLWLSIFCVLGGGLGTFCMQGGSYAGSVVQVLAIHVLRLHKELTAIVVVLLFT